MGSKQSGRRLRLPKASKGTTKSPAGTGPGMEEWAALERTVFTPEQIAALREAETHLIKGFPWLYAEPEQVGKVTVLAGFPRSVAGKNQDDSLLRVIFIAKGECADPDLIRRNIFERVNQLASLLGSHKPPAEIKDAPKGNLFHMIARLIELSGKPFCPRTDSEFFSAIAEGLKYLENPRLTTSNYAVEALQDAFVGFMECEYEWGKKGLPTTGKVTRMAEAHLKNQGKSWKGTWTHLLQIAGLGFLKPGKAGRRPSKQEVDQNIKDKRVVLSKQAKVVNDVYGGNWGPMRQRLDAFFSGKKQFKQDEAERLKEAYGRPRFPEEDQESA